MYEVSYTKSAERYLKRSRTNNYLGLLRRQLIKLKKTPESAQKRPATCVVFMDMM